MKKSPLINTGLQPGAARSPKPKAGSVSPSPGGEGRGEGGPFAEIESLAQDLSDCQSKLAEHSTLLDHRLKAITEEYLPEVIYWAGVRKRLENELAHLIDAHRSLFVKPRTVVLHGIKLGLEKGKGKITIPDPDRTVTLIEKHLPQSAYNFIHVKKLPNRETLAAMPASMLQRLGCTIEDTGDRILIKFTDSAVDKLVKALLADATQTDPQSQAA